MAIETGVDWAKFGAEVRRLRRQAGLSQTQLAKAIPLSQSTVSGIELGEKPVKKDQAERLDVLLTSDGYLVKLWKTVQEGHAIPDWYREVPEMEQRATEIHSYQPLLIPGILQTEKYARASIRAGNRLASTAEINAQVRARIKRQETLRKEEAPFLVAVVDESVLYRPLGTPETMKEQLAHLRKVSEWERAEILVVPHPTWNHPGLDGGFHLLKVPEAGTVLYLETRATGGVMVDRETVEEHVSLLSNLRALALPPGQSRDLIEKAEGEFT